MSVLFPQPLSPTMPNISPFFILKDIFFNIFTLLLLTDKYLTFNISFIASPTEYMYLY